MKRPVRQSLNGKEGVSHFAAPSTSLSFIPSGCTLLDLVLGGGWPLGRISNVVGDKSTGKTLLAIEACTNFARKYPKGLIWYCEAEAAFDKDYAKALGMPIERIQFRENIDTVEDFAEDLKQESAKTQGIRIPGLYILDSLDSLSDRKEMTRKKDEKEGYGTGKAKQMSQLFRKQVRKSIKDSNIHLMIVSQVRDNIGVTFGRKVTRSGGHALDFYASQVLYLAMVEKLYETHKKQKRAVGVRIRAKCDKNKIGLPFRECEFNIRFGFGVEDYQAGMEWLIEVNRVKMLGLSIAQAESLLDNCMDWQRDEYQQRKDALDTCITKAWSELEHDFLPRHSKYI